MVKQVERLRGIKMHHLGLKIWSVNQGYIQPAVEHYRKHVFEYIELYVVPDSGPQYLPLWKEIDVPFLLHAPHALTGFNFSFKEAEDKNRTLIRQVIDFQKALNPQKVIFHPGINGSLDETIRQIKIFSKEFPDLFRLVVIENKPKLGVKGENCLGASPEEMKKVLAETGLGFCFDIGHAICYAAWSNTKHMDVINQFMKLNPAMYHLSDGDIHSKTDMHLNFGKGNFNLGEIISLLPEYAQISIETDKKSKTELEDFNEDVLYFRMCAGELDLRNVDDRDCRDLYEWRSHPQVRQNSFNTSTFSFEDHQQWFTKKRQSDSTMMYMGYLGNHKVGSIRFENEADGIKVNVMVCPDYLGQGIGTKLIQLGIAKLSEHRQSDKAIIAEIKDDNIASMKAFEKAGFKKKNQAYIFNG